MDNKMVSIKVENVKKVYNLYENSRDRLKELLGGKEHHKEYNALNDINFEVYQGETFGIIGTNGAGKSTLLKLITGVAFPTCGKVSVNGKISALLELGAGFNMNYSGLENIYLNGTMMGYSHADMEKRVDSIIEFADIGDFINHPVKTYSSGMFARLAFAVAINIEPEILIVDEALSVGDVFFQNKCYKKFEELRKKNITVIFVSHDIGTMKQLCSRVLWLEHGEQKMVGDSITVCNEYTNSLLNKRGEEHDKNNASHNITKLQVKANVLENENYPKITYTNESILNDEVEIVSCYIEDKNGEKVSDCKAGEKYTLSMVFSSKRVIEQCVAGFVVETVKGLWIINANTLSSGEKKAFSIEKNTLNKIEFCFVMPWLVNGDYVVGVAISEGDLQDFKVLTWLYNVLHIQITNVGNNDGILMLDMDNHLYSKEYIDE